MFSECPNISTRLSCLFIQMTKEEIIVDGKVEKLWLDAKLEQQVVRIIDTEDGAEDDRMVLDYVRVCVSSVTYSTST